MIKLLDTTPRVEFTFPDDTDPKTVFVLRPMTSWEILEMRRGQGTPTERMKNGIEASIVEVRTCGEEKDIKKIVDSLLQTHIYALSAKIVELNHLSDDERKNS